MLLPLAGRVLGADQFSVLLERAAAAASQTSAGWRMLAV
jgi:hypothetical protein